MPLLFFNAKKTSIRGGPQNMSSLITFQIEGGADTFGKMTKFLGILLFKNCLGKGEINTFL
jgi:hypothetical protein